MPLYCVCVNVVWQNSFRFFLGFKNLQCSNTRKGETCVLQEAEQKNEMNEFFCICTILINGVVLGRASTLGSSGFLGKRVGWGPSRPGNRTPLGCGGESVRPRILAARPWSGWLCYREMEGRSEPEATCCSCLTYYLASWVNRGMRAARLGAAAGTCRNRDLFSAKVGLACVNVNQNAGLFYWTIFLLLYKIDQNNLNKLILINAHVQRTMRASLLTCDVWTWAVTEPLPKPASLIRWVWTVKLLHHSRTQRETNKLELSV